jgi:hypothetical protein
MPNPVHGTIIITSHAPVTPVGGGSEPAPTEPAPTGPASMKPAFTKPASTKPAPMEPLLPFARRAAWVSLMKLCIFGENTEWCHAPE